jgi:hypothetical protein
MNNKIEFKRINNDTNGNPRYVCHYSNLLTKQEEGYFCEEKKQYIEPTLKFNDKYPTALSRAKKIGGRKFHNKQYGGGIVFQSYNIDDTEKKIKELTTN